ncbi:SDR family oxidoreductase [soil metagenome]
MTSVPPVTPRASFDLTGRRALVTGSSQGIGLALAMALGQAGAKVVINGRDAAKLDAALVPLRAAGIDAERYAFDVTDEASVKENIARIEAEQGDIHILVNNAGINLRRSLEDFSLAEWHQVMDLNLTSAFLVSRAVVPGMIRRRQGKIINTCSIMSEFGRATTAPYTASKGALKMLTKAMCVDWARHNIQANGLGPGYFRTEMTQPLVDNAEFTRWLQNRTPSGRWGEVQELGGAAVFLASSAADFVNGQMLYVDGGMSASL